MATDREKEVQGKNVYRARSGEIKKRQLLVNFNFLQKYYMYSNNKRFRYITMHLLRYANFPGTDLSVDDHNNYLEGGVRSAPFKKPNLLVYNYMYIVKS